MPWKIPLFKIYWDREDVEGTTRAIQEGMNWTMGPSVEGFEREISAYVGTKYCVTFNSGTSALHSALLSCGIGANEEVVVPSFTFIATANAPLFVGATPTFADIEDKTYGLDPEDVEKRITSRTRAVIPVHYGGCPCLIEELSEVAKEHDLVLIEDAAESLGAQVKGKMVGTYGNAAVLSFCQNKIISTGEGGAVVTDSEKIFEKLKLLRSHGRLEVGDYFTSAKEPDYVTLGYNFRLSTIAAALGRTQLSKIDRMIRLRRASASYMNRGLSRIDGLEIVETPNELRHVYQMYTIRVRGGIDVRNNLMKHLSERGIMTKVYFDPVHLTTFYRRISGPGAERLAVTEKIASEVLTLPMYPTLKEEEMDYIIEQIRGFFEET